MGDHTDERHMKGYTEAKKALHAAFAAYQVWQEDGGDWYTFVDWVEDETPTPTTDCPCDCHANAAVFPGVGHCKACGGTKDPDDL